jgi:hypothetical protein
LLKVADVVRVVKVVRVGEVITVSPLPVSPLPIVCVPTDNYPPARCVNSCLWGHRQREGEVITIKTFTTFATT